MIISKIEKEDYFYFNLHAEQTVTGTFLDIEGRGAYEEILTPNTLQRIENECLKSHQTILDFSLIRYSQNNIIKHFIKIKEKSKSVIFINISKDLIENLEVDVFKNNNNILDDNIYSIFYFHENISDKLPVGFNSDNLFQLMFKEKLKKYIHFDHNKAHTSSSVYLSSYIDLKKFLSLDKEFVIFSIYKLAIQLLNKWNTLGEKQPILVCQNLNSSFIASILSSLLKLDILILDKVGPISKLYSRLGDTIKDSNDYIIVSDLVCLGTEVKIVKNLIEFMGGNYLGNVSIIRTETLEDIHKNFDDALNVFSINYKNNKDLGYHIYTKLESV